MSASHSEGAGGDLSKATPLLLHNYEYNEHPVTPHPQMTSSIIRLDTCIQQVPIQSSEPLKQLKDPKFKHDYKNITTTTLRLLTIVSYKLAILTFFNQNSACSCGQFRCLKFLGGKIR